TGGLCTGELCAAPRKVTGGCGAGGGEPRAADGGGCAIAGSGCGGGDPRTAIGDSGGDPRTAIGDSGGDPRAAIGDCGDPRAAIGDSGGGPGGGVASATPSDFDAARSRSNTSWLSAVSRLMPSRMPGRL